MGIKQKLKNHPTVYGAMLSVLNTFNYFNLRFNAKFPSYKVTPNWKQRIDRVVESPDNRKIETVPDAGKINKDHQVMHNGLKITLGSYYDYGNTVLLQQNRGIHEPQEEYVFQEMLRTLPEKATMMELGSYWAFYSMWFAATVKNPINIMIEPDPHKMNFGKLNFRLNKLKGIFDLGFIDKSTDLKPNIPFYSVDYLMQKHHVEFLDVLHSDIQGYEYNMLLGAEQTLKSNKIGYVFISTHSNELHEKCKAVLNENNFEIIASADLNQTASWDGVLVGRHRSYKGLGPVNISLRKS